MRFRRNQEVKCSKKKGIIVGSVIGTIFGSSEFRISAFYLVDPAVPVFLGGLYLYGMWSERRKKRGGSSTAEENTLLSDGSETVSDCEKGVTKASKNKNKNKNKKNENDGDHVVRPPSTGTRHTRFHSPRSNTDSTIATPVQV